LNKKPKTESRRWEYLSLRWVNPRGVWRLVMS